MPFWGWILVDLGILIIGGLWWGYLIWNVAQRGAAAVKVIKPMTDQVARLQKLQTER